MRHRFLSERRRTPETRESDPGLLLRQEPLCPDRRTEDNRGGDVGQGNRQHPAVKGTKACRCRRREGIRPREERRGRDWFRSLKKLRCFNRLVHLAAGAASTARAHFGRDSTCPDEVEREARNFVGQSGRALASHARGPWSDPRCSGRLLTRCLSEPTPAKPASAAEIRPEVRSGTAQRSHLHQEFALHTIHPLGVSQFNQPGA